MQSLRVLSTKGEEVFTDFIVQVKKGALGAPPIESLGKLPFSQEFSPYIEVPDKAAATLRIELGKYLFDLFETKNVPRIIFRNMICTKSWKTEIRFVSATMPRAIKETR
mgnify:CR=1 FL=1